MCYSAQIQADYRKYVRTFGSDVSLERFVELFWEKRRDGGWSKLPKAMRAAFRSAASSEDLAIADLVEAGDNEQGAALETELFQQRTRLTVAERTLEAKPTKKAENDKRIATDKIARAQRNLADLQRTDLLDRDSRIFPGHYAPVMVVQDGRRVVIPMRYQCRLPGWTPAMERQKPGTYNARRDNLKKAWRQLYGYKHGIMIVNAFYENVARHRLEQRELAPGEQEENVVLEFRPEPRQDMLVACLWSVTKGGEGEADLYSFAAITDEPPAEVSAAGHDRCIVPIKPERLESWLNPDAKNLAALDAILDDRSRPYYEHRMAA
ncbi:SOS response-associated peptidase family protein [Cupriavidus sp. IK-TO18]|uniref:SOS response-associated peptidase family protein n=1 Tax=Cupriavidus sp. IK-TO18 TaxID=2782182 RepID=UPI00189A4976|nr:SOS response-associated peptidase family protein [Cupriavidus sp. IK-TO18]MBF6989428.1 SOS response-associated peptidase family protein [Cupriavidus sp. IK-TO18]